MFITIDLPTALLGGGGGGGGRAGGQLGGSGGGGAGEGGGGWEMARHSQRASGRGLHSFTVQLNLSRV